MRLWLFKSNYLNLKLMIIWNLLIGPWSRHCCGHEQQEQLQIPASCATRGFDGWLSSPGSSSPMDRSQCTWKAAGGCRRLIPVPLRPNASHQPNWDCWSNLVKSGCCYCAAGCALGFTVLLKAHVGWSLRDKWEGGSGLGREDGIEVPILGTLKMTFLFSSALLVAFPSSAGLVIATKWHQ